MQKFSDYYIFTDGSCLGNPGPGGWAFLVVKKISDHRGKKVRLRSGNLNKTTNNLAEMEAMKNALLYLQQKWNNKQQTRTAITIYTDSKYVMNCLLGVWKPKIHADIWEQIHCLYHLITDILFLKVKWMKAHTNLSSFRAKCNSVVDIRARYEAGLNTP